jgi:hypothetical protein
LPTLVTTDPTNGATPTAGGLADPTTQVVIGNTDVQFDAISGARIEAGVRLMPGLALEGGGFFLSRESKSLSVAADANGNPFLFRPFVNVDTGNPNAGSFVSLPGFITGGVKVTSTTELDGANLVPPSELLAALAA